MLLRRPDVQQAELQLVAARADVADLRQQEVAALTKAVVTADDLYRANYASYLEVIPAQRSVLEAELSLTAARRQQFLLLIDLYRALGGGWTAAQ